jgi:Ca2+/Na+ antiporter
VQTGQAAAAELHVPAALLSLVVLAVATSLPNTVVAYQLSRDGRAIACVEEVLSSNGVNLALGSALPLLFWHDGLYDPLLLRVDLPLMVALTLVVLAAVRARHVNRLLGSGLIVVYGAWVLVHVLV